MIPSLDPARALFLVWGPPSHGPRSKVFARALGIPIEFVFGTRRRGGWIAPFKYAYQAIATMGLLWRRRPALVFVQSPPSFAPLVVWLGSRGMTRFVVDAHSDAMMSPRWTRPRFVYRFLARKAVTTIVTNEHFADRIESWGAHATVIRDIPTIFPEVEPPGLVADVPDGSTFSVMVVNTFAADEPLAAVLEAAGAVPDVSFRITGDPARPGVELPSDLPSNVHFTGYLPDPAYFGLMAESDAVMCLTTRNHTMQRGACEALSMGRPVITSDWPLLRSYFSAGTVHVGSDADDIERGVREMKAHHSGYLDGIRRLQERQRDEWDGALTILADRIDAGGAQATKRGTG